MRWRPEFVNNHYYHVLNRGVDGRNIFMDEMDYQRFIEGLQEFNTTVCVTIRDLRQERSRNRIPVKNRNPIPGAPAATIQEKFVEILCYCLMPNHFHLLLKQVQEHGIPEFMRKMGVGYTNYFNLKYERQGHLFQGSFKAVLMENDAQFLHLSRYIHLNPLDLHAPEWRKGKITDWGKIKEYLENYPWSSYPIFVGKKLSPFCYPELLGKMFQSPKQYEEFARGWTGRSAGASSDLSLE